MESYRDLYKFTHNMSEADFYSENFINSAEDGFIFDVFVSRQRDGAFVLRKIRLDKGTEHLS